MWKYHKYGMGRLNRGHGRVSRTHVLRARVAETSAVTLRSMTRLLTRTQRLSRSVKVNVVFFVFGDEESGADPIVSLVRTEADVERFAAQHGRTIGIDTVYWQEIPLQGPEFPYETWPEISELFLVTEGGIGDSVGDTEIDPVALAAFVDHVGAVSFAAEAHNPNVVVRKVALDTALPIPAWITGNSLQY